MKQVLKHLSLINVIGFPVVSLALIIYYCKNPFAWGDWLIVLNLSVCIRFFTAGLISLKNPNKRWIQNTLIAVFLVIWLPSLGLPLAFEYGGLLISLIILLVGLWAIFKIKEPKSKMIFITLVSTFFLFLNALIVVGVISEKM